MIFFENSVHFVRYANRDSSPPDLQTTTLATPQVLCLLASAQLGILWTHENLIKLHWSAFRSSRQMRKT